MAGKRERIIIWSAIDASGLSEFSSGSFSSPLFGSGLRGVTSGSIKPGHSFD
jgi:hypothetical protein